MAQKVSRRPGRHGPGSSNDYGLKHRTVGGGASVKTRNRAKLSVDRKSDAESERVALPIVQNLAKSLAVDSGKQRYEFMKGLLAHWRKSRSARSDQLIIMEAAAGYVVSFAMEGDPFARKACLEFASECLSYSLMMPVVLAELVARMCDDEASGFRHGKSRPLARGRNKFSNLHRDIMIAGAIHDISRRCGILVTRNDATEKESASAVVARLLTQMNIKPNSEKRLGSIALAHGAAIPVLS
jgi:hypothetical protein